MSASKHQSSFVFLPLLVSEALTTATVTLAVSQLSITPRRAPTTWLATTLQFSSSKIQLSSQTSFTAKNATHQTTQRTPIWDSTSSVSLLKHFTKLQFFSATAVLQTATDTWTDTHRTLLDGSMIKATFTTWSIITRLPKASKTLLLKKLALKVLKTLNIQQTTFGILLETETTHHGIGLFRLCQRKTRQPINLMFLISQRFGLTLTTHLSQSVKSLLTETHRTTMPRRNKLLFHPPILFQVSSQVLTKCFKVDCLIILILTVTDSEPTMNWSQLIAHTEQRWEATTFVMVWCLLTATVVEILTTSPTA